MSTHVKKAVVGFLGVAVVTLTTACAGPTSPNEADKPDDNEGGPGDGQALVAPASAQMASLPATSHLLSPNRKTG